MAPRHEQMLRHIRQLVAPHDPASDAALLDRFVRFRDEDAFAELVRRYSSMVLGVCRRVLHDQQRAEDAYQAAFLVLAKKAATISPAASLAAWLHTVARRLALKSRHAEECRRRHEARKIQVVDTSSPRDPLDELTVREMLLVLDEELQRLPKAYRLPLILCVLEGQTSEEAARRLGCSAGAVRGRLLRGRARLHARLVRRGLTLGSGLLTVEALQGVTGLSPELTGATVRLALLFAAGRGAVGADVSRKAAALAEGVMRTMLMTKVKVITVLLGVTLCLTGGGVLAYRALTGNTVELPAGKPGAEAEAPGQPGPGKQAAVRVDCYGDPLPEGALARLGTVRLRHLGGVGAVAFSPDGKTVTSGGIDGIVRLWDVATGKEIQTMQVHKGSINSMVFSPDGKTVVSGGQDGTVRVWEAATGKEIHTLKGHQGQVESVAFSSDGKTVASGSFDGTVRVWEAATGKEIRNLKGDKRHVWSVAFSSDSKIVVSGGEDKTVRLWEVATGKEIRTLLGHKKIVVSVAFSPDAKTVASGGGDGTVRLWEVATGKAIRILRGHKGWVGSVAFSSDGKTVVSGGQDGTVRLWEVAAGKEIRIWQGNQWEVRSVAFSSDDKTVVSGGDDRTVRLLEMGAGKKLRTLGGHQGKVRSVVFSSDGKTVASGGEDKTVRLWEAATGKEIRTLRGHQWGVGSVVFSSDGKMVASGGEDKTVRLWEAATGKEIRTLRGHQWEVRSVVFSSDGKMVASGYYDGTVRLWEVASGKLIRTLKGHKAPEEGHVWIESVAFSPDGMTVTAAGWSTPADLKSDGVVCLWETATGKSICTLKGHEGRVTLVAFSSDGKTVASGGEDGTVRLWEAATGREIRILRHKGNVASMAFSYDGRTLAAASGDCVQLWDLLSGTAFPPLAGHRGKVYGATFSPDDRVLVSVSDDTTGLVWDLTYDAARPETKLGPDGLGALWTDLANADVVRARRAVWTLAATPAQSLSLLRDRLQPAEMGKRLARLVADLGAKDFQVRQRAHRELKKLGPDAELALRNGLEGRPRLELRRRLEQLLELVEAQNKRGFSGEVIRSLRAVEVLERVGTPEARQVLKTLAAGAPGFCLTQEAQAALDRLNRSRGARRIMDSGKKTRALLATQDY